VQQVLHSLWPRDSATYNSSVATYDTSPADGGIQAIFDSSPAVRVHVSAAAETAFLLGLIALCAAPFALMHGLTLGVGVLGIFFAVVGVATASRPNVAGGVLAGVGVLFSCAALVLVGLRYLDLDTAFGDGWLPTIREWLDDLNALLPRP
jgi:hypothetical protein